MKENRNRSKWPYEDIVDLPHHVSEKHPQMSMIRRAAQFAPFAALSGYGEAVEETARRTDDMIDLTDEFLKELNQKISDAVLFRQKITITYFIPDPNKEGGTYANASGIIKKIEAGEIILENGMRIFTDSVVRIREYTE